MGDGGRLCVPVDAHMLLERDGKVYVLRVPPGAFGAWVPQAPSCGAKAPQAPPGG